MHEDMGSVQQNGEKSIRIYASAYQLMQASNQLTRSVGINPLILCFYKMCAILWSHVYQTFVLLR